MVDTGEVTVFWTLNQRSIGVAAISSHDIRHIRSDASDKSDDGNWAVVNNAGSGRPRGYTVSGLTDGIAYGLQVRAG